MSSQLFAKLIRIISHDVRSKIIIMCYIHINFSFKIYIYENIYIISYNFNIQSQIDSINFTIIISIIVSRWSVNEIIECFVCRMFRDMKVFEYFREPLYIIRSITLIVYRSVFIKHIKRHERIAAWIYSTT